MGKYAAQSAFDQLAADYLRLAKNSEEAKSLVKQLRREHTYALDDYYGVDRRRHIRSALNNDLKGSIQR